MRAPLGELSVAEMRAVLARREATAVEITEACLEALRARDGAVHAFVTVIADDALAAARAADAALARGDAGPLAGVPVGVKDLFAVRGVARSNGSAACLDDPPAAADAGAVARLRAAGAVVVGTTHLHEFAFGPTGVNPALGTPTNPWAAGRMPGGSSSGSGAAVAARLVPAALGTDTGGSIRVPASFCGVTGLKPTYGRVTRAGVTPSPGRSITWDRWRAAWRTWRFSSACWPVPIPPTGPARASRCRTTRRGSSARCAACASGFRAPSQAQSSIPRSSGPSPRRSVSWAPRAPW